MSRPWEVVDKDNPNPALVAEAAQLCRDTGPIYADHDAAKMQQFVDRGGILHVFNRPNWLALGYKLYGHSNWAVPAPITDGEITVPSPGYYCPVPEGDASSDFLDTINVVKNGQPFELDGMTLALITGDKTKSISLTEHGNIIPQGDVPQNLYELNATLMSYGVASGEWSPIPHPEPFEWELKAKVAFICVGGGTFDEQNKAKDIMQSIRNVMDEHGLQKLGMKLLAGRGDYSDIAEHTFITLQGVAHELVGDARTIRLPGTNQEYDWWTLNRLPENIEFDGEYAGCSDGHCERMTAEMVTRNLELPSKPAPRRDI